MLVYTDLLLGISCCIGRYGNKFRVSFHSLVHVTDLFLGIGCCIGRYSNKFRVSFHSLVHVVLVLFGISCCIGRCSDISSFLPFAGVRCAGALGWELLLGFMLL